MTRDEIETEVFRRLLGLKRLLRGRWRDCVTKSFDGDFYYRVWKEPCHHKDVDQHWCVLKVEPLSDARDVEKAVEMLWAEIPDESKRKGGCADARGEG